VGVRAATGTDDAGSSSEEDSNSDTDDDADSDDSDDTDDDMPAFNFAQLGRGHPRREKRLASLMRGDRVSSARDHNLDYRSGTVTTMRLTPVQRFSINQHLRTATTAASVRICTFLGITTRQLSQAMFAPAGTTDQERMVYMRIQSAFQLFV
jgi:hypothetical protein